jgi:HAE1 family hydrophobic/amphiphilic exporter-1
VNGKAAVVLAVQRQSGTNTVAVVDEVTKRLNGLRSRLPAGYTLEIVRDQSDFIKDSVKTVQEHLVMGAILAALVVLLFLRNWRSTLIAAIAIPASIVSTFALMYAMGFTLNILTLLALTLAVGIVIDDAIVVPRTSTGSWIEETLPSRRPSRARGDRPCPRATLSRGSVPPRGVHGGIVGRFMYSRPPTFSILVSLLVAFS